MYTVFIKADYGLGTATTGHARAWISNFQTGVGENYVITTDYLNDFSPRNINDAITSKNSTKIRCDPNYAVVRDLHFAELTYDHLRVS
jgi:hypothetical protein